MATRFNNSLSNSIKGKIWLATTALAFFVCIFGIISYLISSFLINDTFYSVVIPFLLLSVTVAVFGWWISNEVVNPVERVLLLTKSLERGVSASLPKTSGSTETDELMETICRLSQQTQKLINSMEEVAQGKLETSSPANADRASLTFQKLLAKVSESIHAKQELEKIQSAIRRLNEEVLPVKQGNLSIALAPDNSAIQEIAEVLAYLVEQLNEVVFQVKNSAVSSQITSLETQTRIENLIEQSDVRRQKLQQASVQLKQIPQTVQKISEELSQSAFSAQQSIEKAHKGSAAARTNLEGITQLRQQIHESSKQIQKLNESSQELGKVVKIVEDLAQRSGMISLNASIQLAEMGEQGHAFTVIFEEIERIAERANTTGKTISLLDKSIQAEIRKVENSLETTISQAANLSKFTIESESSLSELERYVTQFLNLQEKITSHTNIQATATESAFQVFVDSIGEIQTSTADLKESAQSVRSITEKMNRLETLVSHFETPHHSQEKQEKQVNPLTSPDLSISAEQNQSLS